MESDSIIRNKKEFLLSEIFPDINYGNKFDNNKMTHENPTIAFVNRTAGDNGVTDFVDELEGIEPYQGGDITIALGGSLGATFIQTQPFYTGQNVTVLRNKSISKYSKLYIITVIKHECSVRYYPFGRELNKHIKTDFSIMLPVNDDGLPDYSYMENYIKSLWGPDHSSNIHSANIGCDASNWHEFLLTEIFERFEIGKAHSEMVEDGNDCVYLGAKKSNNCVMKYCSYNSELAHEGNCIVFICNGQGSVGYTNYMDRRFIATTDLVMGYAPKLNKYSGLFITSVLDLERPKYSFGRKWKTHLKDTVVKLPAVYSKSGYEPDWVKMEDYIKSLPYGDRI